MDARDAMTEEQRTGRARRWLLAAAAGAFTVLAVGVLALASSSPTAPAPTAPSPTAPSVPSTGPASPARATLGDGDPVALVPLERVCDASCRFVPTVEPPVVVVPAGNRVPLALNVAGDVVPAVAVRSLGGTGTIAYAPGALITSDDASGRFVVDVVAGERGWQALVDVAG